jgi:FixJ family two-component response regulator
LKTEGQRNIANFTVASNSDPVSSIRSDGIIESIQKGKGAVRYKFDINTSIGILSWKIIVLREEEICNIIVSSIMNHQIGIDVGIVEQSRGIKVPISHIHSETSNSVIEVVVVGSVEVGNLG